jgi:hypothetical protein
MDNLLHLVVVHQVDHHLAVLNIALHDLHTFETIELLWVRGISELVQDQDLIPGVIVVPTMNEVAADKPSTAGYKDSFRHVDPSDRKRLT